MTLDRTSRALLLLIAIAILAGVLWLALRARAPEAVVRDVPPVVDAIPPAVVASAASAATPRARLVDAEKRLQGAAVNECAFAAPAAASGVDADDPAARQALESTPNFRAFVAGIQRIDTALRGSPDRFANAVGLWLNLPRDDRGEQGIPDADRMHQLAALATATADPRVYALAFHACRGSADNGCSAVSARRWAEIDAGNAMPWVFLLDAATKAGDMSGQQEAWFHLAEARRMDERQYTQVLPIIASANGSPGDLMGAEALSLLAIGTSAANVVPLATVTAGCRGAALADANRVQLCAKIADVMFERSDSAGMRMSGAAMTRRITGDATRGATGNAEAKLWADHELQPNASCSELRDQLAFLARMATTGPRATWRATAASAAR